MYLSSHRQCLHKILQSDYLCLTDCFNSIKVMILIMTAFDLPFIKKLLLRLICTSVTYTIIRNKWDSFNAFTILVIITSNIYINFLWNLNQRKLPSKTFSGIICILNLFVYTVRNKDTATIFITWIIHVSTSLNNTSQ